MVPIKVLAEGMEVNISTKVRQGKVGREISHHGMCVGVIGINTLEALPAMHPILGETGLANGCTTPVNGAGGGLMVTDLCLSL